MAQLKSEAAYEMALNRVVELEDIVTEETPINDPCALELDMLVDMVKEYEDIHYPMVRPTLVDSLKNLMTTRSYTQKGLASRLGISAPRMSDIMRGKAEPSLALARKMCIELDIAPEIVLGL